MFAYTSLTAERMTKLAKEHSVCATKDGRISVAGITSENVGRLDEAIYKIKDEIENYDASPVLADD